MVTGVSQLPVQPREHLLAAARQVPPRVNAGDHEDSACSARDRRAQQICRSPRGDADQGCGGSLVQVSVSQKPQVTVATGDGTGRARLTAARTAGEYQVCPRLAGDRRARLAAGLLGTQDGDPLLELRGHCLQAGKLGQVADIHAAHLGAMARRTDSRAISVRVWIPSFFRMLET